MSFGPGVRLGPYEIVSPAGAGGMGEVYRARDTRLDRTVAIKVLPPDLTNDPAARQRLEREARAVAALSHPHICTLHDIGQQHGTDFLVMEFLDGETLAARLARAKLPLDQALHYGIQIADALAAAHKAGIVHRDLKPGNVMLTKSGAKLLDFGLAKPRAQALVSGQTATALSEPLTGHGTILGTLQYMAPEQLEGKEADTRTDIFALGALTYEMVTGRRAFDAGTQASAIAKILEMNPPAPSTLAPVCPPALDRLIQRCLAKEPDNRWQSARDVLLELQWIAQDHARGAAATQRGSRRTAWLPWSVAALAVVGAIAAWAWRPSLADSLQPAARFDVPLPTGVLPQTEWLGPPRLSPDGRYVVMAASREGSIQLHLRPLDGTSFTPIPGTEDGRSPFWSPDSRSIAFFTAGRLLRIDVSGGPPRALCDVDGLAYGGSWSPRGDILFAIDSLRAAGTTPGIRLVRDTGGTPAQVTTLDPSRGETGHRSPQFLPDGGSFIFTALGHRTEIRTGSLQNRTTKLLVTDAMLPAFVPPGTLLFLRQESVLAMSFDPQRLEVSGTERVIVNQGVGGFSAADATIAFSSAGEALRKIQWVSRDGLRTAAAGEPGPYYSLALSPSGGRVALQRREVTSTFSGADIWVLEFATGVLSRVTSDQDFESDPSWSPDEKSLAFTARRQGTWQILRKDLTTGTEAPFGPAPQLGNLDEWTPDGRFLIFRIAGRTIRAVAATGDQPPRVIADAPVGIVDQAHLSPDGRWIAFNGNESGRWEVYVAAFPGFTGKRQLSKEGGVQPLWRRDGRELYYVGLDGILRAVAVQTNGSPEFSIANRLFDTGLPTPSPSIEQYAVSANGQRFLILQPFDDNVRTSVGVILNWQALLQAHRSR